MSADTHLTDTVKEVLVRTVGKDRILPTQGNTWDSFFLSDDGVSDDFMETRASQEQAERESF